MSEFGRGKRCKCGVFDDSIPTFCMDDNIIDKFNSIGCTSFRLTPEQIKEILAIADTTDDSNGA